MKVSVRIPAVLRELSGGQAVVEVELPGDESTVAEVFSRLAAEHSGVRDRALDEHGAIRLHVNVFVNSESVKDAAGEATPLKDGDEVWILAAVSGG